MHQCAGVRENLAAALSPEITITSLTAVLLPAQQSPKSMFDHRFLLLGPSFLREDVDTFPMTNLIVD